MDPYNIGFAIGTIIMVIATLIGVAAAFWIMLKGFQFIAGKRLGKYLFIGTIILFVRLVILVMSQESIYNNINF